MLCLRGPILSRRSAREFLKNAVELRQGLKPDRKCDFADPAVDVSQKVACVFEANARDVIDKVYPGYILEFLAQIIPAEVDCSRLSSVRAPRWNVRR
jgi:hypothetical protein